MVQNLRFSARRAGLLTALLAAVLFCPTGDAAAQGKGNGGGKPPKEPPPQWEPVLVYTRAGDVIVADETAANSAVVHSPGATPAWSPDGSRIVFVASLSAPVDGCPAGWALLTLDVAGALAGTAAAECLVGLAAQSIEVNSPAWSVEGIVYSDRATPEAPSWDLFHIDPVSKARTRLTTTEDRNEESPSWSPAADRIVFIDRGMESLVDDVVAIVDFHPGDGASVGPSLSVATDPLLGTALEGIRYVDVPDWSNTVFPSRIAIMADNPLDSRRQEVWLIDPDGVDPPVNLTANLSKSISLPSWSADDSRIVIFTDAENTCNFKTKDRNRALLGIMPSTGVAGDCVDAFIGPPGTAVKQDSPRSLDWYPG